MPPSFFNTIWIMDPTSLANKQGILFLISCNIPLIPHHGIDHLWMHLLLFHQEFQLVVLWLLYFHFLDEVPHHLIFVPDFILLSVLFVQFITILMLAFELYVFKFVSNTLTFSYNLKFPPTFCLILVWSCFASFTFSSIFVLSWAIFLSFVSSHHLTFLALYTVLISSNLDFVSASFCSISAFSFQHFVPSGVQSHNIMSHWSFIEKTSVMQEPNPKWVQKCRSRHTPQ